MLMSTTWWNLLSSRAFMLFCYSRGLEDLNTEFQHEGSFQTVSQPWLNTSLLPLGGRASPKQHNQLAQVRAGPGLLSSLLGLGLALVMQNHQAVVTVILADCCSRGTQQDWDSDLIYLSEVEQRWTHARTIFHFCQQSRAPFMFPVSPAPLLGPSCLLELLHSHPCASPYLQQLCPTWMSLEVSPQTWEELHKWVSNWGHGRQPGQ